MPVTDFHPQYSAMLSEWNKISDVCSSESVIHAKAEIYLPRLSGMDDDKYTAYKNRASFVAFTKRTIEAFRGMVMRKSVEISGCNNKNIDGKGGDIDSYVNVVLDAVLKYGRGGTLVGMPEAPESISVADAIDNNISPRLLFYPCQDIINWKVSSVNNIQRLSLVVLRESIDSREGDEFSHDTKYQYRVLDLVGGIYRQRIFNEDGNEEIIIFPTRQGEPIKFIPFVIHGGWEVQYPMLVSVADLNIHHYQKDADYQHGVHFTALPTPYIIGLDKGDEAIPTSIGPTSLWVLPEGCSCGMLEFNGLGLTQIKDAIASTVEMIIILASRILAPEKSSANESALSAAIRSNSETSSLAGVVSLLSKEITEMVRIMEWWSNGSPEKVKVGINPDFMPSTLSGSDMLSFVTAWIKGGISYESLFNVLKRGEIVNGDRLIADELKDIKKEQKDRLAKEIEKAERDAKMTKQDENGDAEGLPEPNGELTPLDKRIG